jgi:hypothetical protein
VVNIGDNTLYGGKIFEMCYDTGRHNSQLIIDTERRSSIS